ncbi:MAG: DUF1345 domain-containing protein [Rhodanobacteraceae bacterium]|jgi:uncharacterized membrane protein|nr:DUF1345 domain-containing protein [Rhodanobacteraceae bacterium]
MSAAHSKAGKRGAGRWFGRLGRRPRFNLAAGLFVILVSAFAVAGVGLARAVVFAFSIAATLFLAAIAQMFVRAETVSIRTRARQEDQGRWGILWTSVALSAVVLVALGLELHADRSAPFALALAGACLVLAWLFMNTMFALHYAHAYYGDDARQQPRGGLLFPGDPEPDYWDFAYFALVLGMTFQVSDVQITDRRLRRIALVHGLVAFFFNVVIIALSVNVVAGRF